MSQPPVPRKQWVIPRARQPRVPYRKAASVYKKVTSSKSEISAAIATMTGLLTSVPFLAMAVVSAFLITNAGPAFDKGLIGSLTTDSNNTVIQYLKMNPSDFTGLLVFAPFVIALPPTQQVMAGIVAAVYVLMTPKYTILEFGVQACIMFLFMKTNNKNIKLALAIVFALSYAIGYINFNNSKLIWPIEGGIPIVERTLHHIKKPVS